MKIGILGCGVISSTYIKNIQDRYKKLEIAACADVDLRKAKACADKFGIEYGCGVEELLENDEIRMIVNLTPPKFHYELNRRILEAGKHVFCEKPFALTWEQVLELERLAVGKGLKTGGAPDTFLGAGLLRTRLLLETGAIGKPLYISANMMSYGVETWHPSPEQFYQKESGPLYDMGPYYLTAIVALFGPISNIWAVSGIGFEERQIYSQPLTGQAFIVDTPTYYSICLRLVNGMIVNMTISFDIWKSALPLFEVYGTEGTLSVPDPNMSSGMPVVTRKEAVLEERGVHLASPEVTWPDEEKLRKRYPDTEEYLRGAGVMDLAEAIEENRKCRVGTDLVSHVLEAINGIMESAGSGDTYQMKTVCQKPEPLKGRKNE